MLSSDGKNALVRKGKKVIRTRKDARRHASSSEWFDTGLNGTGKKLTPMSSCLMSESIS
jgi:hypothetical protein